MGELEKEGKGGEGNGVEGMEWKWVGYGMVGEG